MISVKMHELQAFNACNKRRSFNLQLKEANSNHYLKAAAMREAIQAILDADPDEDAEKIIRDCFKEIPYRSDKQRELLQKDSLAIAKRFASSVRNKGLNLRPAQEKDIILSSDMIVQVKPDYILKTKATYDENGNQITTNKISVIKLKDSKPRLTQENNFN